VAIAVITVVVVLGRGRRGRTGDPTGDPTAADWTGEAANGDPASVVAPRMAVVGPHRLTVAEAVAAREADTSPLPVVTLDAGGPEDAPAEPEAAVADASALRPDTSPDGSGPTLAAAVAQALALRAARETTPDAPRPEDVRDRLLDVLLDDPKRAVEAAEELVACRGRLGDVLGRLAASGLSVDQIALLSDSSPDDVRGLLARRQMSG
jgi:hypothetical protein